MEPLVRHDISYEKSTGDSGKSNLIQVISGLKGLSNTQMLTTLPNNQTGFEWKVFSIGRSNSIQVSCSLTIEVLFYIVFEKKTCFKKCNIGGFNWVGQICTDVDECTTNTHQCDADANCKNLDGSYSCKFNVLVLNEAYRNRDQALCR